VRAEVGGGCGAREASAHAGMREDDVDAERGIGDKVEFFFHFFSWAWDSTPLCACAGGILEFSVQRKIFAA
jgi:hypothetical protein